MTTDLLEDQELSRPVPDGATEEGLAAAGFFIADLLRLDVRRGDRVLVVSDLHLAPVPSEASTQAADELSELLNGFHQPGMLVIAGDGFEMLAAAPDVAAILDSHPQFTDAVSRFAADRHHRVVLTPGNHDGQLAWDPDSVAVLRDRLGVTDVALACDLAVATADGTALVRVMHGHQFDQYNTFDDPRSPVDTPLGHHIVRQVLPKLASRDHPGALLEGVRWCNGDPAAFLGSRLLYRMVAGWLWWLAVPFAAALVLRFLSFAPGVRPLLSHHAERWLVWFGILVVAIAVVAAVTGIATMLRVNRALADASVGDRGDAAAHNATVRAEAARLISRGIRRPDHRAHPHRRGYSMTLSRMFDERDTGLLLAVCTDPEGKPVAFNQYVPASHVNGYSLDLMRRTSDPEAPNGLTDFVILETINWMAEQGLNGLGLNFAVMRAVVAGENGSGPWRSAERSVFHRFSDSMQIESLWNFNKKYDPQWHPRYSVADDRAHLPRAGLAIARAESVSELPVVGRFMKPKTPAADTRPKELVS